MKTTIGIIGGTGQMGKFFKKFFESNGCKVLVSSRKTELKPEECAKQSDVVLISVPINAAVGVIKKVGPYVNKNSLLVDTASIKKAPVDAMLRYSKCEVAGMHPMFGPNLQTLKEQTIVICPARPRKLVKWLVGVLRKNGAKIKITTPEAHDKMMSLVQGLNHFSSLNAAHAMKKLGITIKDSLEYASPIYKLRMIMAGRMLNQDPKLYADIEIMNDGNMAALNAYLDSARKLDEIIRKKDRKAFVRYFNECAEFFGDFKKEAECTSDYLIERMAVDAK
ncbi:prephenate dehydrogenase/arogenate dehydrogenase family protein [Candidatus Woesearchaeota archaeon]|nr:prephenate dehydrogenase/arogenate dehydrogenase family protein [Candidatus Woesearchaeota archaeon]